MLEELNIISILHWAFKLAHKVTLKPVNWVLTILIDMHGLHNGSKLGNSKGSKY